MKIFLDNGYLNIGEILSQGMPFNFVWGGRGVGKTYGALKEIVSHETIFMLMRRTQNQLDMINKPEFSPFKTLNKDMGWNVSIEPISKYNGGVYDSEIVEDGTPTKKLIGYTCALSTIANIRGFDGSDIEVLIYDEFIPEKHSRPIKAEDEAFLNAYETINRNRELQGKPPLQVLCLANSNALDNPLFLGLGLVTQAERMVRRGQTYSLLKNRGVLLVNVCDSPISEQKRNTALYKLTGDTEFSRMALSNDFMGEDERGNIGSKPLREYNPVVTVGEICIYRHKSKDRYFISCHTSGSPRTFGVGDTERTRFKRAYGWLWTAYLENKVDFEERICEILLTKYFS